jgi:serine/threonine protein phosphatase 1
MHYVIGDVHGNYQVLQKLVDKLPKDATIVFVGDLIDRGEQSAEVVRFVHETGHLCVLGNHEAMMITYGSLIVGAYKNATQLQLDNIWYSNGGIQTLQSYGLLEFENEAAYKAANFQKALQRFEADIRWMQELPVFIELGMTVWDKPVVISHAVIGDAWQLRQSAPEKFYLQATTNRILPKSEMGIFNIFGHTPQRGGVTVGKSYVNVDTGCYKKGEDFHRLSAYCIQTGEQISVGC